MDSQLQELRQCVKDVDSLSIEFMICKFIMKTDVTTEKLKQMKLKLMDAQKLCDQLLEAKV